MKIYGYSNNTEDTPMELSEATLSASPEALRELAEFLCQCAKEIEQDGKGWEHEHFKSEIEPKSELPQFIVFNPEAL